MSTKLSYEELTEKIKSLSPEDFAAIKDLPEWFAGFGWTMAEVVAAASKKAE